MEVQPIGEAVFEFAGQTYRIGTTDLRQHGLVRNSSGLFKDEAEDWSVSFTAAHAVGEFTWLFSFSMGVVGSSLCIDELVKQPAGVEMVNGMRFELVEDEE